MSKYKGDENPTAGILWNVEGRMFNRSIDTVVTKFVHAHVLEFSIRRETSKLVEL